MKKNNGTLRDKVSHDVKKDGVTTDNSLYFAIFSFYLAEIKRILSQYEF